MDIPIPPQAQGGPITPININEINGLLAYLKSIDWSEPWIMGLGLFHLTCILLTICTRKVGAIQTVYFGVLLLLVFCAEHINQWAAEHWGMFAKEQYFDSNGLFISVVFSTPLLINCLVIVVYWLWDVGVLISEVKGLKYRKSLKRATSEQQHKGHTDDDTNDTERDESSGKDEKEMLTEEDKKNK